MNIEISFKEMKDYLLMLLHKEIQDYSVEEQDNLIASVQSYSKQLTTDVYQALLLCQFKLVPLIKAHAVKSASKLIIDYYDIAKDLDFATLSDRKIKTIYKARSSGVDRQLIIKYAQHPYTLTQLIEYRKTALPQDICYSEDTLAFLGKTLEHLIKVNRYKASLRLEETAWVKQGYEVQLHCIKYLFKYADTLGVADMDASVEDVDEAIKFFTTKKLLNEVGDLHWLFQGWRQWKSVNFSYPFEVLAKNKNCILLSRKGILIKELFDKFPTLFYALCSIDDFQFRDTLIAQIISIKYPIFDSEIHRVLIPGLQFIYCGLVELKSMGNDDIDISSVEAVSSHPLAKYYTNTATPISPLYSNLMVAYNFEPQIIENALNLGLSNEELLQVCKGILANNPESSNYIMCLEHFSELW